MSLLLDTNVLLWWLADSPRLGPEVRDLLASPHRTVRVSAVTAWEISIKKALGKLDAPDDLGAAVEACGFLTLPVLFAHALLAGALPRLHDDPFDRMLVAQAKLEGLTLVTGDSRLASYGVPLIPA